MPFDLVKFNSDTYRIISETVPQAVQKFNEASRGAITLIPAANMGDYKNEAFFKIISSLVRRRDANNQGAVGATQLTSAEHVSVKVAAGTPPIEFKPHEYQWLLLNPELAAVQIGEQLSQAMLQDMLNAAIRALVAAITTSHDGSGAVASLAVLNSGAALFGDRAPALRAWIMHSKVVHDVYAGAIANANTLFEFGTVNVKEDGFGRVFVITDSAPLLNATPDPDEYTTLGLVEGAAMVEQNTDFYSTLQETTGQENILATYQSQWSYNLGLKGFAWDKANGGSSPTDTALGTQTNWDQVATSVKDTAGVAVVTQ